MGEKTVKAFFRKIFIDHWQRKIISLLLAIIIWLLVNQSLITSKTITNIPVRIINIPPGKTVVDLQSDGVLSKRVSITLVGTKKLLQELTPNDLEVVIDAQNKKGEWIAPITRRNLSSLNPEVNLSKGVSRVAPTSVIVRLTKLIAEKIPVFITQPIGEAPRDYQFLDIWPYQLTMNVSGPEEIIKRLKAKGVRLTFDLSDISKSELDALSARSDSVKGDEVSFFVPERWKRVSIPLLSDTPIEIDDSRAKDLRIDFARVSLLPIESQIPVVAYFPTESLSVYNPTTISFAPSTLIKDVYGLRLFSEPLFAKGVSQLFAEVVEEMMQMVIVIDPTGEKEQLTWAIEFINPRLLEDRYVSKMMADVSEEEVRDLQPLLREEYLRNRFRSYMNRFQLFKSDEKRLELSVHLENNQIHIEEGSPPLPNSSFLIK
jgi:hypothetical protein